MAIRYEFAEGTASKFWEIDLQGLSVTTRWGRLGAKGQEKAQTFASAREAKAAHDKLVIEKTKKGYKLVSSGAPVAFVTRASARVNATLEEALVKNRNDKNSWQVYADWLLDQNEPWGEVIVAACTNQDTQEQQRAAEEEWIEDIDGAAFTWRLGVLDTLRLTPEKDPLGEAEEKRMARVLGNVLSHPAGRLVRSLTLGLPPRTSGDIAWHFEDVIAVLADVGPLPLLEILDMTPDAEHMNQDSWRRIGDIHTLWKAAPRLRELAMKGSKGSDDGVPLRLGAMQAPYLEKFVYQSSALDKLVPVELGAAHLPNLRHLEIWFGTEMYGNNCTMASLSGILEGKGLPKLETLALKNSEWEGTLIKTVARSALVKRIKNLDLPMGILYQEGAATLREHAEELKHLALINLEDNYLLHEDCVALKEVLPQVHIGEQRELDDEDDADSRYCSVGE